jgi:hypothetical protein
MVQNGKFINYSSSTINIVYPNPSDGFENSERPMSGLVAGTISKLVDLSSGLESVLALLLEFDDTDYSLTVLGTPAIVASLGGANLGYTITLSIHPRPKQRIVTPIAKNFR